MKKIITNIFGFALAVSLLYILVAAILENYRKIDMPGYPLSIPVPQKQLERIDPASIVVVDTLNKHGDSIRHYYPVIQGETLEISYELANRSNEELFIQEVQTSCGCLALRDKLPIVILPGKTNFLHLQFDTSKNSGYVSHYVDCYGNFKDEQFLELAFDVNIVPPADYNRDYEEVWHEQSGTVSSAIRDFVDGKSSQKGYYYDH